MSWIELWLMIRVMDAFIGYSVLGIVILFMVYYNYKVILNKFKKNKK